MISLDQNLLESYRGKTVVLAGGRGYLGAQMASALSAVPCNIIFIDHSPWNDWVPNTKLAHYSHVQGDLRNPDVWNKALPGADVIFFLASVERTFMRDGYNILSDHDSSPKMALALIEKYHDTKSTVPLVYCSSTNIYGVTDGSVVTESTPNNLLSFWSANKLMTESYFEVAARRISMPSTILRFSNIYGVTARPLINDRVIINKAISRGLTERKLTLYKNQHRLRDFLHIDDAVRALLTAGTHSSISRNGDIYIVGSGDAVSFSHSWAMISKSIRSVLQKPVILVRNNEQELDALEYRSFSISTNKFSNATGWEPTFRIQEGINRTVSELFDLQNS